MATRVFQGLKRALPLPKSVSPSSLRSSFLPPTSAAVAGSNRPPSAAGSPCQHVQYEGHYPTSSWQRLVLTGYSAFSAAANPEKADMVAVLGEVTGEVALERLHRSMLLSPGGREILAARPLINERTVNMEYLRSLDADTLGGAYARFMGTHGFSPDSRSPVRFVDDEELAYVMTRYRQVHDLWHVLSGMPPTVEGEVALKWLEMVQTGLPVAALSAVVGPLSVRNSSSSSNKKGRGKKESRLRQLIPWALHAGRRCTPLMHVYYERMWADKLDDVRARLRFEAVDPSIFR